MFTAVRTRDDDAPAGTASLARGLLAGRWRIERELGRGGMGAVYAVVHDDIGKRAALKVVHAKAWALLGDDRFLNEARIVNAVAHPSIVDIFETGVLEDGRPYLVMERLDGQTLGERVAARALEAEEVCGILIEVCDALAAAHAVDVAHCDLKLDNIFLLERPTSDGRCVKVLDWGIAKELALAGEVPAGTFIGTPSYVSPEQARGLPLTTFTDVYSLGVIAYELFLGETPFVSTSAAELLGMHVCDDPPPPRERWAEIPEELELLLAAMLGKEPDDRPEMGEVACVLGRVRAELAARRVARAQANAAMTAGPVAVDTGSAPLPVVAPRSSWRRGAAGVAVAVVIAACVRILTGAAAPAEASDATDVREASGAGVANVVAPAEPASAPAARVPAAPPSDLATTPAAARASTAPAAHAAAARAGGRAAHTAPARARELATLDPDGTIEPYR